MIMQGITPRLDHVRPSRDSLWMKIDTWEPAAERTSVLAIGVHPGIN